MNIEQIIQRRYGTKSFNPTQKISHEDFAQIRAALRENQRLRLDYTDGEGHTSQRIVWPLALSYFAETRILAAWCELRRDFRHFRTDRMKRAQPVGPCPLPRLRMLAEWQRHTGIDLSRFDP